MYDVAVIGAGMAGMATAARLQAAGLHTLVLEAHGLPGGCAGYFRRAGFAFDVGATTLVDFEPGGVGGELYEAIGMTPPRGDLLPGYLAWLPDRTVTLHRDARLWAAERLRATGDTRAHRRLWALFDRIAAAFWPASRNGARLPVRSARDLFHGARSLGLRNLPLVRYLRWTVGDALRAYGLRDDLPLASLLAMLIEDTVHSTLDQAPLINGVLGATIRGAGLTRARGGMYGFWRSFAAHYRALGGELRTGTAVTAVTTIRGQRDDFTLHTRRGPFRARQVVSALPASLLLGLAPPAVREAIEPYVRRDESGMGGAMVVFLGVPEHEVSGQKFTHHQILEAYDAPLGDGNNMFISVSSPGDTESAPPGHRAVMISTHCELAPWQDLDEAGYALRKRQAGERLLGLARRVYPDLGRAFERSVAAGTATARSASGPVRLVHEIATPRTYERFTRRPRGAVGGVRLTLANSNQHAIPHDIDVPGFWLCGDTTWPGLGTVACVLGSRIVADGITRGHPVPRRALVAGDAGDAGEIRYALD